MFIHYHTKVPEFSIQLAFKLHIWFCLRLQPWLPQRRNWRGQPPPRREGRIWCRTSRRPLAGSSSCAPLCHALHPTPKPCHNGCIASSPKRTSDLQVPFHQTRPSSKSPGIISAVTLEAALPALARESLWGPGRGLSAEWSRVTPAPRGLLGTAVRL